jgi:PAS domain S-box-containing protein
VFVNPAACRLTGYAAEELLGRTPRLLQGPNTDRAMLDRLRRQLARGERFAGQAVNYRRDGSEYVIDWHIAPVRAGDAGESSDPSAPVTHFVAVQRDVTARVRAEAERERLLAAAERARGAADEARSAAEAANAAKSQFLTMMSHELRTPLQAIGGYTEILELGVHGPLTAAQRRDLARVRESQEHLLGLIGEVLSYARLGRGMVTYRVTDVPVAEAVGAAEALVLPQLRAKGLGYTWAACDPGLRVRADRDKLQQILVNLLANAVKFTDGAGAGPGERAGQAARVEVSCGGCAPAGAAQDDSADSPRAACASTCATRAWASRRTSSRPSSSRSCRSGARSTARARARGWGWRSAATWRAAWAATSRPRARRGRAARSPWSCLPQ